MTNLTSAGVLEPVTTPRSGGTAAQRGERTLAVAVAVTRAGALVILAVTIAPGPWHGPRAAPLAVLTAVAVVSSIALIASCLATGRVGVGWAALDVISMLAVIALPAVPGVLPGPLGQSPFYNVSVVAAIAVGLPRWPAAVPVGAGVGLAVANIAAALGPGSSYPVWNAVPDSATYLAVCLLAWVLAWLLRTSALSLDRHHEAAVTRAAALALERERARQQHDLGSHLLTTMDELATGDVVTDPRVREQVRRESRWLRRVVDSGLPEPNGALLPALRDVVAEKTAAGMRIDLKLPDREPTLTPVAAHAVVEAVREALTNVDKHAGTRHACVTTRTQLCRLVVEVTDAGRGYDPACTKHRIGQRLSIRGRMEAVGGHVEFESRPGSGTRVRLTVPGAGKGGDGGASTDE